TREVDITKNIQSSLTEIPPGVNHTMCFVGVGDHGGGPTEAQVRWCLSNAKSFPGAELVFSTPDRFFDAIEKEKSVLPLVTGELQMHAVGCFSVHRSVKTRLRNAEHALSQAALALEHFSDSKDVESEKEVLDQGWERVAFSHFHDTLAGTCIPSAYEMIDAHLGHALSLADEILQVTLRKKTAKLPVDKRQRIVLFNTSGKDWSGMVEVEPWFEWKTPNPEWTLLDDDDKDVPYQNLLAEAATNGLARILFPAEIKANNFRVYTIKTEGRRNPVAAGTRVEKKNLVADQGLRIDFGKECLFSQGTKIPLPVLNLFEDTSDTWSHGVARYEGKSFGKAKWEKNILFADQGPLFVSAIREGKIGSSELRAEWRLYGGLPFAELQLRIHWCEEKTILKMLIPSMADKGVPRFDGTMGGHTPRAHAGRELPMQNWTLVKRTDGHSLGIVSPDVFALDGNEKELRLTLLRSPVMAHHDPHKGLHPRSRISDRGEHFFKFRFYLGKGISIERLERAALEMERPPVMVNATLGMPTENQPRMHGRAASNQP
ncbi:MAG: hypothetical protein JNM63_11685, partial [Spirochaetia bacterium]|nr:hypothetical protein [Spirochaetia bacterium]